MCGLVWITWRKSWRYSRRTRLGTANAACWAGPSMVPGTLMKSSKAIAPEVSVVMAVRNVEDVIGSSVKRVVQHLRSLHVPFEVLAVNDGSWDTSFAVLRLLAAQVPELRLIEKDVSARAYVRGAAEARGATVILMDAASVPASLA